MRVALAALRNFWSQLHHFRLARLYIACGFISLLDYFESRWGMSSYWVRTLSEAAQVAHDLAPDRVRAPEAWTIPDDVALAINTIEEAIAHILRCLKRLAVTFPPFSCGYGPDAQIIHDECKTRFGLNPTQCERVLAAAPLVSCVDATTPLPPLVIDPQREEPAQTESARTDYLTVDLDFWSKGHVDRDFLYELLAQIPIGDVVAAVEHHSILPHSRRYRSVCKRLINLDFHSDLGGSVNVTFDHGDGDCRRLELHAGSWGDYVEWEQRGEFVWVYPDAECLTKGRTDDFNYDCDVPFSQIPQHPRHFWWVLSCRKGEGPNYGIELSRVRALSIVLSPDFCGSDASEVFEEIVGRFRIPVIDRLP